MNYIYIRQTTTTGDVYVTMFEKGKSAPLYQWIERRPLPKCASTMDAPHPLTRQPDGIRPM